MRLEVKMNFLIDQGDGALAVSDSLEGERFRLALDRIRRIREEELVHPSLVPFFQTAA